MKPEVVNHKNFNLNTNLISKNCLSIISRLHRKGFQAYIVGGGVRDLIQKLAPKDFDIVRCARIFQTAPDAGSHEL